MLTEKEVQSLKQGIKERDDQMLRLNHEKCILSNKLRDHYLEAYSKKFPVEEGDLVDVTTAITERNWRTNEKVTTVNTQRLYYNRTTFPAFSDVTQEGNVQYVFNEVKKDGSKSKRTTNIFAQYVTDIKKVAE